MLYLQLRNELWKLFGKKRTYLGFVMFLLAQNAVILIFRFSRGPQHLLRVLTENGYPAEQFLSALTIATVPLVPIAYILLPLYSTLVGGDLVAKEVEDGTLRMILSRPISRVRLLVVKWLAGLVFSVLLALSLGLTGLVFARLWYPWGDMFVSVPEAFFSVFDPSTGLARYAAANALVAVKAATVMTLALMFSCFNVKPAAATVLALSLVFVSLILQQIPYFRDLQPWFLTYHLNIWQNMLATTIPWWRISGSLSLLVGFNVTFLLVGAAVFHARDIKS